MKRDPGLVHTRDLGLLGHDLGHAGRATAPEWSGCARRAPARYQASSARRKRSLARPDQDPGPHRTGTIRSGWFPEPSSFVCNHRLDRTSCTLASACRTALRSAERTPPATGCERDHHRGSYATRLAIAHDTARKTDVARSEHHRRGLLVLVIGVVTVASAGAFAAGGAAAVTIAALDQGLPDVKVFEDIIFSQPTRLVDRSGKVELGAGRNQRREVVEFDDVIAPYGPDATLPACHSRSTGASATSSCTSEPRGERPGPQARVASPLRRPAASRDAAPLRLPAGDRRRPCQLGGAPRPVHATLSKRRRQRGRRTIPSSTSTSKASSPSASTAAATSSSGTRARGSRRRLDDPAASVEDGELKFILHGERLRGRFVLVRTQQGRRPRRTGCSSTSRRRAATRTGTSTTCPTSVLTGRTNEEVAGGEAPTLQAPRARSMDDIDLSAAREAQLPEFIRRCSPRRSTAPFSHPGWLFELKLDGYRVEAVVGRRRGQAVDAQPQGRGARTSRPSRRRPATGWRATQAIVDGEMVALDADGRPSFSLLQDLAGLRGLGVKRGERSPGHADAGGARRSADADVEPGGQLVFHAFDLLHLDGRTCSTCRSRSASGCSSSSSASTRPSATSATCSSTARTSRMPSSSRASRAASPSCGSSRYEPGQAVTQLAQDQGAARAGARRRRLRARPGQPRATSARCSWPRTRRRGWRYAGEVGSGMDASDPQAPAPPPRRARRETPPVLDAPPHARRALVRARHVIRAEFTEWTTDGLLRQAVLQGPRDRARSADGDARAGRAAVDRRCATDSSADSPAPEPLRASEHGSPAGADWRPRVHRGPRRASPSWSSCATSGEQRSPAEAVTRPELEALADLGSGGRWEVGGHAVELTQPRQGPLPRRRVHQARPRPLLHDDRAGPCCPTCASGRSTSIAGPMASTARRSSGRSRSRRTRPTGSRAGTIPRPATTSRTRTSSPTAWRRWPGSPTRPSSTCIPGRAGCPTTGARRTRSSTSTRASARRGRSW